MPQIRQYYLLLITLLLLYKGSFSQSANNFNDSLNFQLTNLTVQTKGEKVGSDSTTYTIHSILITGNKKTRDKIILREVPFTVGEEYPLSVLKAKLEDARRQLMNTTLFIDVVVSLSDLGNSEVDILVDVRERWYIFPVPYFKPVDRNLNQWLFEKGANLGRVNYGLKLLHNNLTGSGDKLRLSFVVGYTRQFSVSYDRLYIDNQMKWGLTTSFAIGNNKEINYNTIDDKQVFLKEQNGPLRKFINANTELTYRRAIKTRHRIGLAYVMEEIGDTVAKLNPDYFKNGRTRIQFPELYYRVSYFDLDYIPYPTKGYAAEFSAGKKGLNNIINMWYLTAKGSGSWHTGKNSFVNVIAYGTLKAPFKQPYFMQRFLGYGDAFMQGYEYYVVDGVAGGFLKTTYTRKLFQFSIKSPGKNRQIPERIPFKFYGKIFGNAGYVHNPQPGENRLSNRMLYSTGVGIDIFTSYDFTLKLEWTFNQLGENGLFLHRKTIF